jgi:hypothetical protein
MIWDSFLQVKEINRKNSGLQLHQQLENLFNGFDCFMLCVFIDSGKDCSIPDCKKEGVQ